MNTPVFEPISTIDSFFVFLEQENIDTDQILPGEFLTTTDRTDLGEKAFYHWRFDENGKLRSKSIFESPQAQASKILVAGRNFGCGSSREHAAWALHDFGFRAILSPQLGDIFRSNCLMNGVLAIEIGQDTFNVLRRKKEARLRIDLERQEIAVDSYPLCSFSIDPFSRLCLRDGIDPLGFLLANEDAIKRFESHRSSFS